MTSPERDRLDMVEASLLNTHPGIKRFFATTTCDKRGGTAESSHTHETKDTAACCARFDTRWSDCRLRARRHDVHFVFWCEYVICTMYIASFFFDPGCAATEPVAFSEKMILRNPEAAEEKGVEVASVFVSRLREVSVDERLHLVGKAL